MDILYVVGNTNREELRYSLRSIEHYGINVGNVYLAGYCPEYVNKDVVRFIDQPDVMSGYKHNNILNCIKQAVLQSDIADNFLYSSDDHFYVNKTDFDNYPYFCKETLVENYEKHKESMKEYHKAMRSTYNFLKRHDLPMYNFAFHGDTHFNKTKFLEILPLVDEAMQTEYGVEPTCLMLNAMYADERYKFDITYRKDYKAKKGQFIDIDDREVVSTSDMNFTNVNQGLLHFLFKKPCKYEVQ